MPNANVLFTLKVTETAADILRLPRHRKRHKKFIAALESKPAGFDGKRCPIPVLELLVSLEQAAVDQHSCRANLEQGFRSRDSLRGAKECQAHVLVFSRHSTGRTVWINGLGRSPIPLSSHTAACRLLVGGRWAVSPR